MTVWLFYVVYIYDDVLASPCYAVNITRQCADFDFKQGGPKTWVAAHSITPVMFAYTSCHIRRGAGIAKASPAIAIHALLLLNRTYPYRSVGVRRRTALY